MGFYQKLVAVINNFIDDQIVFAGIPFVLDLKKIYKRII